MGCAGSKQEVYVKPDEPAAVESPSGGVKGGGEGAGGASGGGVAGGQASGPSPEAHSGPAHTPSPAPGAAAAAKEPQDGAAAGGGSAPGVKRSLSVRTDDGRGGVASSASAVGAMAHKDGEMFHKSVKDGDAYLLYSAAPEGSGVAFKCYNPRTSATIGRQMSFTEVREMLGEDANDDDKANVARLGTLMYTEGSQVKFKPANCDTFDGTAVTSPVEFERGEKGSPVQVARKSRKIGTSFFIFNASLVGDGTFMFDMFSALSPDQQKVCLSRDAIMKVLSEDEQADGTDKALALAMINKLALEDGKLVAPS